VNLEIVNYLGEVGGFDGESDEREENEGGEVVNVVAEGDRGY
jgi:hypothetical protein